MIIVTGASGFVGSYLVDQLIKEDFDVLAIGRNDVDKINFAKKGIEFSKIDITRESDFNKLPKKGVEAVVHLAGLLSIDIWSPKDYFMTNTVGTRNVMDYCQKNDVPKAIYSMTHSDVNRANETIITENTPQNFAGARGYSRSYIISKIAGREFVDCYSREYGISGISLRLPGIRGFGARFVSFWKGEPKISASQIFIQRSLKGLPIEVWGNNNIVRDLVYIKDITSGIINAINCKNASGSYNLGSGTGITIEDEVKAIIKAFSPPDKTSKIIYRPDHDLLENRSYIFDISKAKNELGYSPKYTYEEAMNDYKAEMGIGRYNHLILNQENILKKRSGKNLKQMGVNFE